jgi:hypothetical protein
LLSDPRINLTLGIRDLYETAIENNNENFVQILMDKSSDNSTIYNTVITYAAKYGRTNIMNLLLKDKRVHLDANIYNDLVTAIQGGFEETVKILLADSRINILEAINIFQSGGDDISLISILSDPNIKIPHNIKVNHVINSLCGLTVGIYFGNQDNSVNVFNKDIVNEYVAILRSNIEQDMYRLSSEFILDLIANKLSLKHTFNSLKNLSEQFPRTKPSINKAVNTTLTNKLYYNDESLVPLYGALRGYLLLSYEPRYTIAEIKKQLIREGAPDESIYLALEFIGTYIGIVELRKQGLKLTDKFWVYAKYIYEKYQTLNKS